MLDYGRCRAVLALVVGIVCGAGAAVRVEAATARASRRTKLHPSWNGDFSTGNWSQYDSSPAFHPDGQAADFGLVRRPTPRGFKYAFRATLDAGNGSVIPGESGERTLLTLWPGDTDAGAHDPTRAYQGASSWYRDDIYFPGSFRATRNSDFNWLYELHQYPEPEGDANLALAVVMDNNDHGGRPNRARLSTRILGGGSPAYPIDAQSNGVYRYTSSTYQQNPEVRQHWLPGPRLRKGHWYDFVWHVRWDWRSRRSGGHGFVEYFIDGRKIGTYFGPTLFFYANNGTGHSGPGQAYLQVGYYRPDNMEAGYSQPMVSVYHAATMIGRTATSIGEHLH